MHGGLEKAVYAYPIEHDAFWREHRGALGMSTDLPYGSLGENLTLRGVLEASLYVGDALRFPDCVLRVTQPRGPCYKLNAAMDDSTAVRTMAQSGYCGFYLAAPVSIISTISANRTVDRVNALSSEILDRKPDFVGIQEAWLIWCEPIDAAGVVHGTYTVEDGSICNVDWRAIK